MVFVLKLEIEQVISYAKRPGLINSVSEEEKKCEVIYPLIKGTEWQVIALTRKGIANYAIPFFVVLQSESITSSCILSSGINATKASAFA